MKRALFIFSVLFFIVFFPKSVCSLELITPKITNVQLPFGKAIKNLLLDDDTCYKGYQAFVFFSLAVIAEQFLTVCPHTDEEAIKDKISGYVSSGNITVNMVKFFDELVNRYGGLEEQRVKEAMELTIGRSTYAETTEVFRETINVKIIDLKEKLKEYTLLENHASTFAIDNQIRIDSLLEYLYKNIVKGKLSEKRVGLYTKIRALVHKLDNLGNDHRKLYLIAGEFSESIDNITKVFDNAQKGDDFKIDTYSLLDTIRKASDVNPSIKLNVEVLNSIIQLGTKIKEHIDWAYAPQRGGSVYNFIQKINIGLQTGTGTLIQYEGIDERLKGRVVLTVGHNYLNIPFVYSKDEMEANADSKPFAYNELNGIETVYEEPKDRSDNFTVSNMRFNGEKIKRIYAQTERDIAIFILENKSALGDGAMIIPSALQAAELSSRNFYTIGYGGYNYMENIEFGKKKATIKSNIHIVDGDIYADPKLPNFRVLSCASGDSGSPIIYSPNEENNTIIGIFASSGNDSSYLNEPLFNWINAVCTEELELSH